VALCGDALGKLVDALVLDRALCFDTEEFMAAPTA
jgi:hypothetical protein